MVDFGPVTEPPHQTKTTHAPSVGHPTAVPLARIAEDLASHSRTVFTAKFGDAFLVLLASAPAPAGRRPRMTHDLIIGEGNDRQLVTAALPLRSRLGIAQSFLVVGRDDGCDVPIFDGTVSKMHACIELTPAGVYRISDSRSRNGTLVNGVAISVRGVGEPTVLTPGATLRFGSVPAMFVDVERLERIANAFAKR